MTTKRFYVWGNGSTKSKIIRSGEPSEAAKEAAFAVGFKWGMESWAVEVEAMEDDLDAETRFDRAVAGWCEARPWFTDFTVDEAVLTAAIDAGYGEDEDGRLLELVPRSWDPDTGLLTFDDGRFHVTVRFKQDGTVELVRKV